MDLFCIFTLHAQGVYKTDKDLSYPYHLSRCYLNKK